MTAALRRGVGVHGSTGGGGAAGEDPLQEVYLRAWRTLVTFRRESQPSTWLMLIVIDETLGRLRWSSAHVIPLEAAQRPGHSDQHALGHHTGAPMRAKCGP